jgi:hypothetical protein
MNSRVYNSVYTVGPPYSLLVVKFLLNSVHSALFFFIQFFLHVLTFTICHNQIYSVVKGPFYLINGPENCLRTFTLPSSRLVSHNVYSGGTWLESRTRCPSSWLKIFLDSSVPSDECRNSILKAFTTASFHVVCCSLFMIIRSQSVPQEQLRWMT